METGSKISHFCDGLIEAGWLAAVIVTPLYFNLHSSRVFEPDRVTLLRSIALIMAAAWLVKFIDRQGWKFFERSRWRGENSIWRMPFVMPVFLLVVIYLVSTAFSVTRLLSWAGSYQRLQGTYTILAYITIFALLVTSIRSREQVTRLVSTIIITSIPISLYGMLQRLGLDPIAWTGAGNVQARITSTLGNSIFLAAYLIMVVPLTLARTISASTDILDDGQTAVGNVIRALLYCLILIIQVIAIFWSGSRGPFLGLVTSIYAFVLILLVTLRNSESGPRRFSAIDGGRAMSLVLFGVILPFFVITVVLSPSLIPIVSFALFLAAVAVVVLVIMIRAISHRGWRWLWLSWILLAMVLAVIFGLFNASGELSGAFSRSSVAGTTLKTLSAWRGLPEIGRFGQLLESESGYGRVRVLIWEGVTDLIAPHEPLETPDGKPDSFNTLRPIIGYGPESMSAAYNRYYRPELASLEGHLALPDRSHNETFDAIVITGLTGLFVWQLLYLSVFYFGFRWLGVVRTKRDRNVLIGLWIGGGLLGGVVISSLLGRPFLGVAVPFGTIMSVVIYLIYYALVVKGAVEDDNAAPFSMDRLLMIALVSAILAHYVEIHFGIAITATRTYFFVYLALIFSVGFRLPMLSNSDEQGISKIRRQKGQRSRDGSSKTGSWVAPVLSSGLILALIIGILAYNFVLFQVPDGQAVQTIEDVPSVAEIIRQSFFVNVNDNFTASPFLYMGLVATWLLGSFIFLSDLSKSGKIGYAKNSSKRFPGRLRIGAMIFLGMLLMMAVGRFLLLRPIDTGVTYLLGLILLPIWAFLSAWVAIRLLTKHPSARLESGVVATLGIVIAIPLLFAGAILYGIVMFVGCSAILYLIWDPAWNSSLLPGIVLALFSFGLGSLYTTYHAFRLQTEILPSPVITGSTPVLQQRLLEVNQTISLLTTFYIFVFVVLSVMGLTIAWPRMKYRSNWGSIPSIAAAILLIPIILYFILTTNLHVTQADMAFRQAELWSKQARASGELDSWDTATAIYQRAIELDPAVETYHRLLGDAYVKRSAVSATPGEQETLLSSAESQLLQARDINPLNTDNTVNLARISAYWAGLSQGDDRERRISSATEHYDSAISLSPKSSNIINEYARFVHEFQNDCLKSLALYDRSAEVDPFFLSTHIDKAEVYLACGDQRQGEEKQDFYELALASANQGREGASDNARRWLQLAIIYIKLGRYDEFIVAYDNSVDFAGEDLPQWQINLIVAEAFSEIRDFERAKQFGQLALDLTPPALIEQVQQLVDGLQIGGAD